MTRMGESIDYSAHELQSNLRVGDVLVEVTIIVSETKSFRGIRLNKISNLSLRQQFSSWFHDDHSRSVPLGERTNVLPCANSFPNRVHKKFLSFWGQTSVNFRCIPKDVFLGTMQQQ